jgi:hypothetical protein
MNICYWCLQWLQSEGVKDEHQKPAQTLFEDVGRIHVEVDKHASVLALFGRDLDEVRNRFEESCNRRLPQGNNRDVASGLHGDNVELESRMSCCIESIKEHASRAMDFTNSLRMENSKQGLIFLGRVDRANKEHGDAAAVTGFGGGLTVPYRVVSKLTFTH